MNSFEVRSLKPNSYFTDDLLLDEQFFLLDKRFPLPKNLIKQVRAWNFKKVYSKGELKDKSKIKAEIEQTEIETVDIDFLNDTNEVPEMTDYSSIDAGKKLDAINSEQSRLEIIKKIYKQYSEYLEEIYTHFATHKKIDRLKLSKIVSELIRFCSDNRRFVLRINPPSEQTDKNFLVNHAMRSTIIAITVGLRLHLNFSQLSELSEACILHEIGMLRLPPQLYITNKKLLPQEKAKLASHPILGYEIIKSMGFSVPIQRAVLEHHEKENGSGYPRHIEGQDISTYAKIIAVACAFEAITAPRQYRSARPKYEAMLEILKNSNNQYNEKVIKALLLSFSIYPIGVYVYLQNGKIAQISDTNPDDPKHPIAQVLGEKAADGDPRTVEIDDGSHKVVRVLNPNEVKDVLKTLGIEEN